MSFGETEDHEGEQPVARSFNERLLDFSPASSQEAAIPVGGWLLYFCIAFTIFSPVSFLRAAESSHSAIFVGLYGTLGMVIFFTGLAVWSRSRYVMPMIWLSLALRSVYSIFQIWVALRLASRTTQDPMLTAEKEFTNAAVNIAGLLVTFFYFRLSSRVKQTYGKNL